MKFKVGDKVRRFQDIKQGIFKKFPILTIRRILPTNDLVFKEINGCYDSSKFKFHVNDQVMQIGSTTYILDQESWGKQIDGFVNAVKDSIPKECSKHTCPDIFKGHSRGCIYYKD